MESQEDAHKTPVMDMSTAKGKGSAGRGIRASTSAMWIQAQSVRSSDHLPETDTILLRLVIDK